jgi:DNA-directed RNA polymerase alpha subunit
MKTQTPAEGIMKTGEYGDSKFYKVVCGCGQPDHDLDFEVEADETGINVNTYVTAKTDYWSEAVKKRYDIDNPYWQELDWTVKDIINGLVTRLKLTWIVWTKGYIKCESTIAMSEQQAFNYAETLKSAIQDVKDFKKS